MPPLQPIGKLFYGLGIAGIGFLQFIYPWFRPVILPIAPEATNNIGIVVYVSGVLIVLTGIIIAFMPRVKTIALVFGAILVLLVLAGHLPNRLTNQPDNLGAWTDALKLLALAGGAFMVAVCYPPVKDNALLVFLDKLAHYGKYFFAVMLIIFGIDHFIYAEFVKGLVPEWMPGHVFWTYFSAVALIGSGLAIILRIKPQTISLLLATMLLLWLILLHIPRAMVAPATDNGNEWTSVFECLAFAGMAILYPFERRSAR